MPDGRRSAERYLTTVLMTDIVGSTEHAAELGDGSWRELVEQHHAVIRAALRRHGGREIDTAGDGFFAIFDAPAAAVGCALEAAQQVVRDQFREATAAGREAVKDPATKAYYAQFVDENTASAYAAAMNDRLVPPTIKQFSLDDYTGQVGDTIRVTAFDNFGVVRCALPERAVGAVGVVVLDVLA